jgi:hypothetical protein
MVALTLDVKGHDPSTIAMPFADLTAILEKLQSEGQFPKPAGESDLNFHRRVRRYIVAEFPKAKASGPEANVKALLTAALWTAFEHPASKDMRKAVSQQLRATGKAHLTAAADGENFIVALGEAFTDLTQALQLAQGQRRTVIVHKDENEPPLS